MAPCNYIHAQLSDYEDSIHPECIADRHKQEAYLGNIKIVMMMEE